MECADTGGAHVDYCWLVVAVADTTGAGAGIGRFAVLAAINDKIGREGNPLRP